MLTFQRILPYVQHARDLWVVGLRCQCTRCCILELQTEVTAFQDECSRDLEVAEPIIAEAEAALNSLDKASLGELKSFGSPAAEVVNVVSACMVLTAPGGKIPKVKSLNMKVWALLCSNKGTQG